MIVANVSNPSLNLSQLSGYWLSARFNPANGFQSEFWVGVVVERDARDTLPSAAVTPGASQVGNLQISGEARTYTLENAELFDIHSFITRRRRFLALEFRLDFTNLTVVPSASLDNTLKGELAQLGSLTTSYQYALDSDGAEHLLGLGAARGGAGLSVYRFLCMRNSRNGWLPRLVEWDESLRNNRSDRTSITVKLAQAPQGSLELDGDTTQFVYATERFGLCNDWPLPDLRELRAGHQPTARLLPPQPELRDVIDDEEHAGQTRASMQRQVATETADVLMHFGDPAAVALT